MKKIFFALCTSLLFVFSACSDLDISVDSTQELADITTIGIYVYDPSSSEDLKKPMLKSVIEEGMLVVDPETNSITAQISPDADITQLKVVITVSYAARVTPEVVGLQDMSQPKVFTVVSANGTVKKDWRITVTQ